MYVFQTAGILNVVAGKSSPFMPVAAPGRVPAGIRVGNAGNLDTQWEVYY